MPEFKGRKFLMISLSSLLMLSGCASATGCLGWKPIRTSASDLQVISDSLVNQILEHDEYGAKACGWAP